jgi:hypothetical protein
MGPHKTEPFTVSKPHHSTSLVNNNENAQSMEPIMTVDPPSLQDPDNRPPEATKLEREDNLPPPVEAALPAPIESTPPKATEDVAAGNDIIVAKANQSTEAFVEEKVPIALDSGNDAQFITEQPPAPAPSQAAHPINPIEENSLEDFLKPAVQVKLEDAVMEEGIGALLPPPPPTTTTTANNSLPATAPAPELSTGINRSKRSKLSLKGGNSWHNADRMFWNSTDYTTTTNTTINNSQPKEHPAAAATGCDNNNNSNSNNNNNQTTTNNYNAANDLVSLASQPRQDSQVDMEDDEIAAALYDLAAAPPPRPPPPHHRPNRRSTKELQRSSEYNMGLDELLPRKRIRKPSSRLAGHHTGGKNDFIYGDGIDQIGISDDEDNGGRRKLLKSGKYTGTGTGTGTGRGRGRPSQQQQQYQNGYAPYNTGTVGGAGGRGGNNHTAPAGAYTQWSHQHHNNNVNNMGVGRRQMRPLNQLQSSQHQYYYNDGGPPPSYPPPPQHQQPHYPLSRKPGPNHVYIASFIQWHRDSIANEAHRGHQPGQQQQQQQYFLPPHMTGGAALRPSSAASGHHLPSYMDGGGGGMMERRGPAPLPGPILVVPKLQGGGGSNGLAALPLSLQGLLRQHLGGGRGTGTTAATGAPPPGMSTVNTSVKPRPANNPTAPPPAGNTAARELLAGLTQMPPGLTPQQQQVLYSLLPRLQRGAAAAGGNNNNNNNTNTNTNTGSTGVQGSRPAPVAGAFQLPPPQQQQQVRPTSASRATISTASLPLPQGANVFARMNNSSSSDKNPLNKHDLLQTLLLQRQQQQQQQGAAAAAATGRVDQPKDLAAFVNEIKSKLQQQPAKNASGAATTTAAAPSLTALTATPTHAAAVGNKVLPGSTTTAPTNPSTAKPGAPPPSPAPPRNNVQLLSSLLSLGQGSAANKSAPGDTATGTATNVPGILTSLSEMLQQRKSSNQPLNPALQNAINQLLPKMLAQQQQQQQKNAAAGGVNDDGKKEGQPGAVNKDKKEGPPPPSIPMTALFPMLGHTETIASATNAARSQPHSTTATATTTIPPPSATVSAFPRHPSGQIKDAVQAIHNVFATRDSNITSGGGGAVNSQLSALMAVFGKLQGNAAAAGGGGGGGSQPASLSTLVKTSSTQLAHPSPPQQQQLNVTRDNNSNSNNDGAVGGGKSDGEGSNAIGGGAEKEENGITQDTVQQQQQQGNKDAVKSPTEGKTATPIAAIS